MRTQQIRQLIDQGMRREKENRLVRNELAERAGGDGRQVSASEIDGAMQFVIEYVEHAPALIEMIEQSATEAGIYDEVSPILKAAEDYFLAADDLIPDNLGLLGLMDDAYLAHCLIQAIADRYKAQLGSDLLPADMAETNALFRNLVEEPCATMLDERVRATLNGLTVEPEIQMEELMQLMDQMNMAFSPDPTWGDDDPGDIASARLNPMGLV